MSSRSRAVVTVLATVVLALARPAAASRCHAGLTDGANCVCPDYGALLADPSSTVRQSCPSGWTPVIYDLDGTYVPDGTSSTLVVRAKAGTPCSGLVKTVPMKGQLVMCWSPVDGDGCRNYKIPFNGMCLGVDAFTLGSPCSPECANVEMPFAAIATSGQGPGHRVCAPHDPMTSCRATANMLKTTSERFAFQLGGFCATYGCDASEQPDADTCVQAWGASYFGFGRGHTPLGEYDWRSGGFKVILDVVRGKCGTFRDCLGQHDNPWTLTVVANPAPGYEPPCLDDSGTSDSCNPGACFLSSTTTSTPTSSTTSTT